MKNIYAGLRKVGLSYDSWHDSLLDRTLGFSRCNMEFEDYLPCLLNEVAYLDLETKFTTLEK
jgi:hypothetical protein